MIEDNPDQKFQSKRKTYAPVVSGSKHFSPCTSKNVDSLGRIFGNLHEFSGFAHTLWEATKPTIVLTDNKPVTQFFQTKSYSTMFVERMRLCAAVQLGNNTCHWFSNYSSWLSRAIRIEIHGEGPSQDQGRCTNNAHWGHNILLRCCRLRAILLRTSRWWRRDWRTNPWRERAISEKGNIMGSTWGTILNEAK